MIQIKVITDLLRNELKDYYEYLKDKYGFVSTIDDLFDLDNELIDNTLDGDSELLFDMLNKYINGEPDLEFDLKINNDSYISNLLKLLIVVEIYEYGLYNQDMLTFEEKEIISKLSKNPTSSNGIKLFNQNYLIILNLYSAIFLDNLDNYKQIEYRKKILDDNCLNNIIDICPYAIFDFRFLLGLKFEGEEIESIKLSQEIISIVEKAMKIIDSDNMIEIQRCIRILIEVNQDVASFIESNQNYIISNIYEHLLNKNGLTSEEKEFIRIIEKKGINSFMSYLFKIDESLELLIYMFYIYNKDIISEKSIYDLRQNTRKKGKIKVIEKINPFYDEETSYFNNKKGNDN